MLKLSERLETIASMVDRGARLADIGTDHAFVPAALLERGLIRYAYACDIGRGPLERAEEHLKEFGLLDRAETRLSDGLEKLLPGEADTVLIAGLGGDLMIRILSRAPEIREEDGTTLKETVRQWVLSPHTAWRDVRAYLRANGYRITDERMVCEEGKYYVVISAVNGDGDAPYGGEAPGGFRAETEEYFGPVLLGRRDPVLRMYLLKEERKTELLLKGLRAAGGEHGSERRAFRVRELEEYLSSVREALLAYG